MDHKREHRLPPLARAMGVGRQQQQQRCLGFHRIQVGILHKAEMQGKPYLLHVQRCVVQLQCTIFNKLSGAEFFAVITGAN